MLAEKDRRKRHSGRDFWSTNFRKRFDRKYMEMTERRSLRLGQDLYERRRDNRVMFTRSRQSRKEME